LTQIVENLSLYSISFLPANLKVSPGYTAETAGCLRQAGAVV